MATTSTKTKKSKRPIKKKRPPIRAPMIRTSERSLFNTCKFAWDKSYNQRLKPIQEKPALRFGTLVHKALEVRYPTGKKRGPKPAITFEKLYDKEIADLEAQWGPEMIRDADAGWVDMKELGIDMLEHYVETYGKDEEWEVISSELTFKVPVYAPEHPDGMGGYMNLKGERIPRQVILFYYVGTMDGVWRNRMDASIAINDYKTTANDPEKELMGKTVLDEQGTAYWTWGVDFLIEKKILKPRELEDLNGMLYTFLKKKMRETRPQNAEGFYLNKPKKDALVAEFENRGGDPAKMKVDELIEALGPDALLLGEVSADQPSKWFHRAPVYRSLESREKARERAVQQAIEMWQRRNGILPIYKSPDTGAMGHCGWCGYRDVCELHEEGADWELLERSSMTTWDPYDAHEIYEENKRR